MSVARAREVQVAIGGVVQGVRGLTSAMVQLSCSVEHLTGAMRRVLAHFEVLQPDVPLAWLQRVGFKRDPLCERWVHWLFGPITDEELFSGRWLL